jgi:hypothetical protein
MQEMGGFQLRRFPHSPPQGWRPVQEHGLRAEAPPAETPGASLLINSGKSQEYENENAD